MSQAKPSEKKQPAPVRSIDSNYREQTYASLQAQKLFMQQQYKQREQQKLKQEQKVKNSESRKMQAIFKTEFLKMIES